MRLQVVDHPLVSHKLTALRDERTASPEFRRLTEELVTLLAYEATRDVRTEQVDIRTPVSPTTGVKLSYPRPLVVPTLRAGLGMLPGMLELVPNARVGHLGLQRDERTAVASQYYAKLPKNIEDSYVLLIDPMLATGGSAVAALDMLTRAGGRHLRLVCIVAAPEGVAAVERAYPSVPIFTPVVDRELNAHKFIVPGLGDFGDRLFGTI